jgi:hypothetical protein
LGVGIDEKDALSFRGETRGNVNGGGGFADSALHIYYG